MVTNEYKIAYNEVLEILKYVYKEDFNKIPEEMIQMFKTNAEIKHDFIYNPNKTLQEQNVSEIARTIIAILFRDYWATKEQREKILNYQKSGEQIRKVEIETKKNSNNLFSKKNGMISATKNTDNYNIQKQVLVEYKESFWKRLFNKILKKFKK